MAGGDEWQRVARAVTARRELLDMRSRTDLARRMGVSIETVRNVETGRRKSYKPYVLRQLELALGWSEGSVERVLAGGEPELLGSPGPTTPNLPMPTAAMTGRVDLSSLSDAELAARNTGTVAELMAIALEFRRRAESSPGPDDDEFDDDTVFARWDASLGPPPEPPPSARPARGA